MLAQSMEKTNHFDGRRLVTQFAVGLQRRLYGQVQRRHGVLKRSGAGVDGYEFRWMRQEQIRCDQEQVVDLDSWQKNEPFDARRRMTRIDGWHDGDTKLDCHHLPSIHLCKGYLTRNDVTASVRRGVILVEMLGEMLVEAIY